MVWLVCFNDPLGHAVELERCLEPLTPDWPKVRFQIKRDTRAYAVRGRSEFASATRLFIRRACASEPVTRDGVTAEEDPTSLKKANLQSETREGPDIRKTLCQGRGNRSNDIPWTWHHHALSSAHV